MCPFSSGIHFYVITAAYEKVNKSSRELRGNYRDVDFTNPRHDNSHAIRAAVMT